MPDLNAHQIAARFCRFFLATPVSIHQGWRRASDDRRRVPVPITTKTEYGVEFSVGVDIPRRLRPDLRRGERPGNLAPTSGLRRAETTF